MQLLSEMVQDFIDIAHSQVWCNVATLDGKNRLRSRVLHPFWELDGDRVTGWIATGRHTPKTKHLEGNPTVSLTYIQDVLKPAYADCHATWDDDQATRQRIWDFFSNTPPPLGYNMPAFFTAVDNPEYGVLKLTPWRIELADLLGEPRIWRP